MREVIKAGLTQARVGLAAVNYQVDQVINEDVTMNEARELLVEIKIRLNKLEFILR